MKTGLLCLSLATFLALGATAAAADRPNFVVVLVDDMGWSDIGCYGSEVPTPNLDAMAAEGVRFTQFYNTGRCSPTRASLITGHYPHQAGMGHLDNTTVPGSTGYTGRLADSSATIAEVLKPAGYFTAMTGKWHLGQLNGTPPWKRGFDRSLDLTAGGVYFPKQGMVRTDAKLYLNGVEMERDDPTFGDDWYGPYLWTDWGLKFVDEAIAQDKPFFLYVAHCSPHFPLMAPQADIDRYRGKYLVGWDVLREQRRARQIELGLIDPAWPLAPLADGTPAWADVPQENRDRFDHIMSIYAAMIDTMDQSVGRLVQGLKDRGQLDNTLILFLSDNGGNAESGPNGKYEGEHPGDCDSNVYLGQNWATLANTPFRKYKHFNHEGGISAPLIAHWPAGIPKERNGAIESQPSHLVDIMATAVDVSGATYPTTLHDTAIEPMEGVSLVPAFRGESVGRTAPIFFEHEGNRAARDGKWKIVSFNKKPWELYDMEADRTELNNVAAEHPQIVKRLGAEWRAWADRTGALPWPLPKKSPQTTPE